MFKVAINTKLYEKANGGKLPKGRGNWAFSFGDPEDQSNIVFFNNLYGHAREQAIAEAKKRETELVYVMP